MILDSTRRFSSRVGNYVRWRPSYPSAVVEVLVEKCGLEPSWAVADVGSGPGNLTRLFLDHGSAVFGVEPNREMREAGERLLASFPRFTSIVGTAEATGLENASVDLAAAGQAFHWFDVAMARREFARVLRRGRWVAIIWNERALETTPFLAAYERLLDRYGTDYNAVKSRGRRIKAGLDELFGPRGYELITLPNEQRFNLEGLRGRLLSSSYSPEIGQPGYAEMLDELVAIFDANQTGGEIVFPYDTRLYLGQLPADPNPS